MQTKLTLRLDADLVQLAKTHSRRAGKSVSQMVADYFRALDVPDASLQTARPAPVAASLRGILRDCSLDEADYRRHLEERHV